MSIAYTGMNKSLRHKGYYTQNIKCLRIRAKLKSWKKRKWSHHVEALSRSRSQLVSQKTTHVFSYYPFPRSEGSWTHLPSHKKTIMRFPNAVGSQPAKSSSSSETSFPIAGNDPKTKNVALHSEFDGERIKTCLNRIRRHHHDKATMTNFTFFCCFRRPATAWLPWDQKKRKKRPIVLSLVVDC